MNTIILKVAVDPFTLLLEGIINFILIIIYYNFERKCSVNMFIDTYCPLKALLKPTGEVGDKQLFYDSF